MVNMNSSSVLVAVRGERCDVEAVRLGFELLNSHKGKLHILYVIEVERGLPIDAVIAPATAKGEEVLKHMEEITKAYKCRTEAELVQAREAGSALVQEAVERNVDAIVLAVPETEHYGSFSLGETIPYVLKNAPCRVVVCRDPASDTSTGDDTP